MREAFRRSAAGFSRPQVLGPAAAFCFHTRPHFVPPEAAVIAASKYRGKVQPEVAAFLRAGNIVQTGSVFVQEQSAQRWAAGTIANKDVVVSQFKSFLESAGLLHVLMDKPPEYDVKPMSTRRREENLLATWGMMRVMSGQKLKGAEQYVSHVRTWYVRRTGYDFGVKGFGQEAGGAVKAIRSCREYFPPKNPTGDEGRSPVTLEILEALVTEAQASGDYSLATAHVLAFNGLYRMGELTATTRAFDWKEDLAETDVEFIPSYEHAVKVIVSANPRGTSGGTAR